MIKAGTLDGTIGATQTHGALRTLDKPLGPGRETVDGTEFDAGGSEPTDGPVAPARTRVRTAR